MDTSIFEFRSIWFYNRGVSRKSRFANSVDADEMAHYEASHLHLHCLQRYLFGSTGLKELNKNRFDLLTLTTKHTIHMKWQALFSLKNKYKKVSSAVFFLNG